MKRMGRHEILQELASKWEETGKRHLYLVMGTCSQLRAFEKDLIANAKTPDRQPINEICSVNSAILKRLPEKDLEKLVNDEAKYPIATHNRIKKEFEELLSDTFKKQNLVILKDLEFLFAFGVDLAPLRLHASNGRHLVLLLPGEKSGNKTILYHETEECFHRPLPSNLVMENHTWEISHAQ